MVATERGLALSVVTADCAPVLLADPVAGVIGAAHAGWRGALGGVLEAVVERMQDAGAQPRRITAVIGPCIHQPSYQVGPEFEDQFTSADPANARFFRPGPNDRRLFDLPGFAAERLRRVGLGRVEALASDTCADAVRFFSNRRSHLEGEQDYGRNCSAIVLPG
jgi:YfiH family protein